MLLLYSREITYTSYDHDNGDYGEVYDAFNDAIVSIILIHIIFMITVIIIISILISLFIYPYECRCSQ